MMAMTNDYGSTLHCRTIRAGGGGALMEKVMMDDEEMEEEEEYVTRSRVILRETLMNPDVVVSID